MSCTFCQSSNQREFPAEVNIHLPGLRNSSNPGVFVFPKLLVSGNPEKGWPWSCQQRKRLALPSLTET